MKLMLYNTLSRKKEEFKPINGKKINLFVCGITPYNYAHIGHAKTYIQFDIIVKFLRYIGYNVFYLQNVTDIDDKIINRADELKITPKELAGKFEKFYHEDEKSLGINSVTKYARATDYIKEIVSQVERLIDKGYAYKTYDGYYYDLSKFREYGKLSGRTVLEAEDAVSRIDEGVEKKNKGDFCLWKFYKNGGPFWDTEIGKGRPGWHIEDTAITEKFFGPQYDIHGGAVDLIFPHHEAEIAQIEAVSGKKPMVSYWMHTGFLNIDSKKMSKSLGNFITIKDVLKKYDAKALRLFFIMSHYRSPINFSEKSLEQAEATLKNLNNNLRDLKESKKDIPKEFIDKAREEFLKAMYDDIDTPKALTVIFDLIREANKLSYGKNVYELVLEFDKIFSIIDIREEKISKEIKDLLKERGKARNEKNFEKSDELRKKIEEGGYTVQDTPEGSKISKI